MAEENKNQEVQAIKINIDGQEKELTPEEVIQTFNKLKNYEEQMAFLKQVGDILGFNPNIRDPEKFISEFLYNFENKYLTTEEGKKVLEALYNRVVKSSSSQIPQEVDKVKKEVDKIKQELFDTLGEKEAQKILDYLERQQELLKQEYLSELQRLKEEQQKRDEEALVETVEAEYRDLVSKHKDVPDWIVPSLIELYFSDEKGRSMTEIYEQVVLPQFQKFFSQEGKTKEEIAEKTAEALKNLTKGSASASGSVPPPAEEKEFSVERLIQMYKELGIEITEDDLPDYYKKLK